MQRPSSPKTPSFVGIDVAKNSFQAAALPGNANSSFAYDASGIKALLDWLNTLQVELIVLEATGGYQRRLVAALAAAGLPVVVANPRQIRDFAKVRNILAKTDRIDAGLIADFAQTIRPQLRPLPSQNDQRLRDLVARRGQLVAMNTSEQNRLAQCSDKLLAKAIGRHIHTLEREIKKIEALIEKTLAACPDSKAKVDELKKHTGLGEVNAVSLVAAMPEIGALNRRQIASLAGLAPFASDSGTFQGKRRIWGGRAAARATLYMITMTLLRWDEAIKSFHQKLLEKGKKKKVALAAVMRKVLVQLNAKVRDALAATAAPTTPA
jgi:transposase